MEHIPDSHSIIGIGIRSDPDRVFSGIASYSGKSSIRCYLHTDVTALVPPHFQTIISEHPEQDLIDDLFLGTIDAAIRGTLSSHHTLQILKETAGVSRLERVVLLETADGSRFFLGPVGIDEGWTISEKVSLIEKVKPLCHKFGLPEQVTVLSGGRLDDIGRHPGVDRSLADAELVARLTGSVHRGILIEEAVQDSGFIVAPDGISGNLIFRTLLFLGSGRSHGAPVLNIPKIFVDTSRVNPNYLHALNLADILIELSFLKKSSI